MEPTAKVIVRHAARCPDRRKGSDWRRCDCRKSLLLYDGTTRTKDGKLTNRIVTAKTRSWAKAERAAQDWLDSFDPEKQELRSLRAAKERQAVRIEEAVALYCADTVARLGDNGTVKMIRSLFGHVHPETKQVARNGHLFTWLDKQVPRPMFVADLSPSHLAAWRAAWAFGDLTAAQRWTMVKSFFNFCEGQGWLDDSPARKLKPLKAARGNRTAIFTDEQYAAILDAVYIYDPENVPAATRQVWQQRLTTFLELLRWTGMDLADAVRYTPSLVDQEGVLHYRRQKTGQQAVVPLPENLIVLLRDVPLERDSVGPSQPFRQTRCSAGSDARKWARRLETLFKLAGITEVQTERRARKPHTKMLRDTFAVWHLRHGARLHTVAKMMGHASTTMTEKAYLPWVKELEAAHIDDARQSLKHIPKKKASRVVSIA